MLEERLVRDRERKAITGYPQSTWYKRAAQGLAPPPIRLSKQAVAWPLSELLAMNRARIAGASDDEIRKLVVELVAARKNATTGRAA